MSENKTTQGYVLLKAIDHSDWGGKQPIAFAETKEELEELCEKNGYDYKGEKCVSAPTHYIQTTESYMGRLMLKPKDKCENNSNLLWIKLLCIPYTELFNIFHNNDTNRFRIFTNLQQIIADKSCSNIKITSIYNDDLKINRMDDILGEETSLVITITTPENTALRVMQDGIYEALKDFLEFRYKFIPESRTHDDGLPGIALPILPVRNMKDECFTFEIVDTLDNGRLYNICGCMMSVNNDDGRLVIKFRLLGYLQLQERNDIMSENKKYVLLEVTGIDQWGGLPDVEPILYADTKEELEEICEKNGYEYKDSAYPTHYIEATESYMERLNRKFLDNYIDPDPKIVSVKLRGIPYVELLNIFDTEDFIILESFISLKRIINSETYTDIKIDPIINDDVINLQDISINDILGLPTNLVITISDHHNPIVKKMKDSIREVLCFHMTGIFDPFTGFKTYHGLAGTVMEYDHKNERFIFELEDTNHKKYYMYGTIPSVSYDEEDDETLIIKFRIIWSGR